MKKAAKIIGIVLIAAVLLFLYYHYDFSAEQLLYWQPNNLFLASITLLAGYALKSATVFFPLMVLQITAGILFPGGIGVLVNFLGLTITMTVPFWIGKKSGTARIQKLIDKYPKAKIVDQFQHDNEAILCFMLRACSTPPGDIVTMYLGAAGISWKTNLIFGVLGYLPGMLLTTFLGATIRDPGSLAFWTALGLRILWIALSSMFFWFYRKSHSKGKRGET